MRVSHGLLALPVFIFSFRLKCSTMPLKEWPLVTPQSQLMNVDLRKAFDEDIAGGKYG